MNSAFRAICQTAFLGALLGACADQAVVGEDDPPEVHSGSGGGSAENNCEDTRTLSSLPANEASYAESPALWVESARGTWSNAAGDLLEVQITNAVTRLEQTCHEDAVPNAEGSTPTPPASGESPVKFALSGEVILRTADGAWNETMQTSFSLSARLPSQLVLSGKATLPLATLRGTFKLPSDLVVRPADVVEVGLSYQEGGWILSRDVSMDCAMRDGVYPCGGGLYSQAWRGPPLAFARP